jgi:ABC-type bacteriocin/lantibiotic exporter with double-glycine peptidase domain
MLSHFVIVFKLFVLFLFSDQGADPRELYDRKACGAAAVYSLMHALDSEGSKRIHFKEIETLLGEPPADGYSLSQLSEVAKHFGFEVLGIKTRLSVLRHRSPPYGCICHMQGVGGEQHYVVLADINSNSVVLWDGFRQVEMPNKEFESKWDGVSLIVSERDIIPEAELQRTLWYSMVRKRAGIGLAVCLVSFVIYMLAKTRISHMFLKAKRERLS